MGKWIDKFLKMWGIAREARQENAPRQWLLVDAYSAMQSRPGVPQTYGEALEFLRDNVGGYPVVRIDHEAAIIFFDGRKPAR